MFFTNLSGVVLASHSTPAWWMVMYFGVCLRDSGIGWGVEPHSLADTIGGFRTPGVTSGFFASWLAHAKFDRPSISTAARTDITLIGRPPLLDHALGEAEPLVAALRVVRVRRVEARDLHLPRRFDELVVTQVDGRVRDGTAAAHEEQDVAALHRIAVPAGRDELADDRLLLGVARQVNALPRERRLHEAGAIHAFARAPAPDVRQAEL